MPTIAFNNIEHTMRGMVWSFDCTIRAYLFIAVGAKLRFLSGRVGLRLIPLLLEGALWCPFFKNTSVSVRLVWKKLCLCVRSEKGRKKQSKGEENGEHFEGERKEKKAGKSLAIVQTLEADTMLQTVGISRPKRKKDYWYLILPRGKGNRIMFHRLASIIGNQQVD